MGYDIDCTEVTMDRREQFVHVRRDNFRTGFAPMDILISMKYLVKLYREQGRVG